MAKHVLKIAKDLTLGLDAVTKMIAILAMRGMGKSYTASVLTEQMLKAGGHVVVVDPLGVFWGLRSSEDGRHEGLPIPIFGGDHADVPLDPNSGTMVADLIINERLSVVLDLSRMTPADAARFMLAFAERLYHKNRKPLHLILDEADEWAPQHPMHGKERLLGAIENLVRRGRARGLGVTLVTQRSAVLNKNVLSQADLLVVLRTVAPQDRKAIDAWVQANGDEEGRKQVMNSLASLQIGEAWFWSPGWLGSLKRAKVNRRETFDSSATPKMGVRVREPKKLSVVDLDRIKGQMSSTIEQAKKEDPRELKAKVASLESELARVVKAKVVTAPAIGKTVEKVVEKQIPVITPRQEKRLKKFLDGFKEAIGDLSNTVTVLAKSAESVLAVGESMRRVVAEAKNGNGSHDKKAEPQKQVERSQAATPKAVTGYEMPIKPAPQVEDPKELDLKAGAVNMLARLFQFRPTRLTRSQISTLTGFTESGGTFASYLSKLRRFELIDEASDGTVGIVAWPAWVVRPELPHPTPERVVQMWREKFKAGVQKMLDLLMENREQGMTREELAEKSGFEVKGGTFASYLSQLRRNGLIKESGDKVMISDEIFLGSDK